MKSSLISLGFAFALAKLREFPSPEKQDPLDRLKLTVPPTSLASTLNMSNKDGFVFVSDPDGEAAHRYRDIVEEILSRAWPRKRMLVTSPAPGEGKTITSVNMALALADKGHSVFLAELTLMRPRYRFVFGAPPNLRGVESVLTGDAAPDDVTFQLGETRVAVASVGSPMANNDLLQKKDLLEKLIAFGESKCDWVILDLPSMEESRTARELASAAGPVIMVARSHRTKLQVFRRAASELGDKLDYVLLNDIAS